jgi:Superinfection immunity protein
MTTLAMIVDGDPAAGFVFLLIILLFYFVPTIAARGKPQFNSVLAINFFLGWTRVGWVIALAWAVKQESVARVIVNQAPLPNPVICANCGKYSAPRS